MVTCFGLLAQSVRSVRQHYGGDAEPFEGLGVPEVRAVQQRGLLLQGECGEERGDVELRGVSGHIDPKRFGF